MKYSNKGATSTFPIAQFCRSFLRIYVMGFSVKYFLQILKLAGCKTVSYLATAPIFENMSK